MTVKADTQIKMVYRKETKNTYVFDAEDEKAVIPTVYVRKENLPFKPKKITLTLQIGTEPSD